ncbi:hypothetical protein [Saccharopolyspora shandongensis]|uniref:hypothetical protein n=1 Tax=Saccharopolyspora shandongensis TaxID=418495 RepID=UPI0033E21CF8
MAPLARSRPTGSDERGGRPKVIDADSLAFARALRAPGTPMPGIAAKPTIKTGKNAGKHPSVASLHRALADTEDTPPAPVDQVVALRPKPAKIRRPG